MTSCVEIPPEFCSTERPIPRGFSGPITVFNSFWSQNTGSAAYIIELQCAEGSFGIIHTNGQKSLPSLFAHFQVQKSSSHGNEFPDLFLL